MFTALRADPRARTSIQALTLTHETVTVLFDFTGPLTAVTHLRQVLLSGAQPCIVHSDVLIDEPKHMRFIMTWTRPTDPYREGVSLEHILHDKAGVGALLFGRIEESVIAYKAASPGGRGLQEFLDAAQRAFGNRFRVRPIRAGPFRPGWEIDDTHASVDPEEEALLAAALQAGYYDEPKRCGVRELGDALGVSKSVVARRLRHLERRALERMVS